MPRSPALLGMQASPLPRPLRVAVLDDHPVVIQAVDNLLRNVVDMEVSFGDTQAPRFLRKLERTPVDVVLIDYRLPGQVVGGGSVMRQVRSRFPQLFVIALSGDDSIAGLCRADGVHGFFPKRERLQLLAPLIRVVHAGGDYVIVRDGTLVRLPAPSDPTPKQLSTAESAVLRALSEGLSLSDIARLNRRQPKTVSQQKRDAMRKLGLSHDSELAAWLREHFG